MERVEIAMKGPPLVFEIRNMTTTFSGGTNSLTQQCLAAKSNADTVSSTRGWPPPPSHVWLKQAIVCKDIDWGLPQLIFAMGTDSLHMGYINPEQGEQKPTCALVPATDVQESQLYEN